MKPESHSYTVEVEWSGNLGAGTRGYRDYARSYQISAAGRPMIEGSSDPAFRGDPTRYNPEELLVAALSSCHMLWYLHLCSEAGVVVIAYRDRASGRMAETEEGGGHFTEVVLKPKVTIAAGGDPERAAALHARARQLCFVASSVNFPVRCEPAIGFEG